MIIYVVIALVAAGIAAGVGYGSARNVGSTSRLLASTIGIIAMVLIFFGAVLTATIVRESAWKNAQPEMNGMVPMVGLARSVLLLFLVVEIAGYAAGWIYGRRRSRHTGARTVT
jgi:TRAP-type C4-dicarboxylate transport system permease small subunit